MDISGKVNCIDPPPSVVMSSCVSLLTPAAGHLTSAPTAEAEPWDSAVTVPLPPLSPAAVHSHCVERSYWKLRLLHRRDVRLWPVLDCLRAGTQPPGPETVRLPPLSLCWSHSLCPGVLLVINSLRGYEAICAQVTFATTLSMAECDLVTPQNGASSASKMVIGDRIIEVLTSEYLDTISAPALAKVAAVFGEPVTQVKSMTAEEISAVFGNAGGFSPGTVDHLAELPPLVLALYHFGFFCTLFVLLSSIPQVILSLERHRRMLLTSFSLNSRRKGQTTTRSRATIPTFFSRVGETIVAYFDSISETIWCLFDWL